MGKLMKKANPSPNPTPAAAPTLTLQTPNSSACPWHIYIHPKPNPNPNPNPDRKARGMFAYILGNINDEILSGDSVIISATDPEGGS